MINKIKIELKTSHLLALFLLLLIAVVIPTLCSMLMKEDNKIIYWDGTIADSYHDGTGTINDPYIIETPSEFAYFSKMITNGATYEDTYFKLNQNIYINNGVIELDSNNIKYIKNYKTYYIKPNTSEFYQEENYITKEGNINILPTINGFEGTLDGNNKHIYGLYIIGEEAGLFNNLEGTVKNLYVENSLIYGQNASLITSAQSATITGLNFSGTIKSEEKTITINKKVEDVEIFEQEQTEVLLPEITIPQGATNVLTEITGQYQTTNNENKIIIDGVEFTDGTFSISTDNLKSSLNITTSGLEDEIQITDINYKIDYNYSTSSLIGIAKDSIIENTYSKGTIMSDNQASGIVGTVENKINIKNTYTNANIISENISSGIIGSSNNATISIENTYSNATLTAQNQASAFIGYIDSKTTGTIKQSFTTGVINASNISNFIGQNNSNISADTIYTTINNTTVQSNIIPTYIDKNELLTKSFFVNTLQLLEYNSKNTLVNDNVWIIKDNELPYLYTDDKTVPTVLITFGDYSWDNYRTQVNTIKNPEENKVTIAYNDQQSDILKVEYYISKDYQLTPLNTESIPWQIYDKEEINLSSAGNYTIYVKITDTSLNVTYAHTDMIIYDNYNSQVVDPINNATLEKYDNQITSTSSIKYIFSRNYQTPTTPYQTTDKLYLKGDIPINTKIYLYDKVTKTTYYTQIIQQKQNNLYDLNTLQELGNENINLFDNTVNNYYQENTFSEYFEVILDFSQTSITENKQLSLELVVLDNNQNIITSSSKQSINLVAKMEDSSSPTPAINLESTVEGYFLFQKDELLNIPLTTTIENKILNSKEIYDSNYQNLNLSIQVKILDSNKESLTSTELNKLMVNIDDKVYYFNENGKILIPNQHEIETEKTMEIKSIGEPVSLKNGTYYIEIKELGLNDITTNKILVPIKVDNKKAVRTYNYKIQMPDDYQVWNRQKEDIKNINSYVLYDGNLEEPVVKVFLYKKVNFSSLSQEYEKININDYLENATSDDSYIQELDTQTTSLELDFDVKSMSLGGYKLKYELYDGSSYVGEETKTFVVK